MPTEEFNIIANSACTNNNGAPTLLFFYDHLFLCTHVHRLYNIMYMTTIVPTEKKNQF